MKPKLPLQYLFSQVQQVLLDTQAHNALLSAGIILQIEHSTKELGVGLTIIWISITFLTKIWQNGNQTNKNQSTLYALLLGLLLIQTRTILKIEDEYGLTQYFLIGLGIAAAAGLTLQQWKRLLQWMGATSLPLLALFGLQQLDVSTNFFQQLGINSTAIVQAFSDIDELRSFLQETVFSFLAISGIIAGRISSSLKGKIMSYLGAACGFVLCLITDSRMAIIAPILSIILGVALSHTGKIRKLQTKTKIIFASTFMASILSIVLAVAISPVIKTTPDLPALASDKGRVNIALCWANSMLSGNNRFIYGSGHNKEFIMQRCTDEKVGIFWSKPGRTRGHAHNVLAHMMGLHGLFGIFALTILSSVYVKGLIGYIKVEKIFNYLPLTVAPWSEAIITMGVFIMICSFSTTFFVYNHTLQVMIGLALGMPLASSTLLKHNS